MKNKKKIITGIWFFGPSGSGKTFASKFIARHKKNCIIIDGDVVRKYISFDLGYSKQDRDKQINTLLALNLPSTYFALRAIRVVILLNRFPASCSGLLSMVLCLWTLETAGSGLHRQHRVIICPTTE